MKAILLVDHGSTRDEANEMLSCMANLVQHLAGDEIVVRYAHMELAEPSISAGVEACVEAGATEIVVFPYMLSPGRHSTTDIPAMVAQAARHFNGVRVSVTAAFGVHEKLAEVVLLRAAVPVVSDMTAEYGCRCWNPDGETSACGQACPARERSPALQMSSEPTQVH